MRVIRTPRQRARISLVCAVEEWHPFCSMGLPGSESMEVDLGYDNEGRQITLLLKGMEASNLAEALEAALRRRSAAGYYDLRERQS